MYVWRLLFTVPAGAIPSGRDRLLFFLRSATSSGVATGYPHYRGGSGRLLHHGCFFFVGFFRAPVRIFPNNAAVDIFQTVYKLSCPVIYYINLFHGFLPALVTSGAGLILRYVICNHAVLGALRVVTADCVTLAKPSLIWLLNAFGSLNADISTG